MLKEDPSADNCNTLSAHDYLSFAHRGMERRGQSEPVGLALPLTQSASTATISLERFASVGEPQALVRRSTFQGHRLMF